MALRKPDCSILFTPTFSDHRTVVVHYTSEHPVEFRVLHSLENIMS